MNVGDCLSATGTGFINLSNKCPKAVTITLLVAAILIALAGSYGLLSHYNFVKDYLFLPKEASIALTSTGGALTILFSAMIHCQRMGVSRADAQADFPDRSEPIEVTTEDVVCLQGEVEKKMHDLSAIVKDALKEDKIENLKVHFETTDDGNLVFLHPSRPGLIFKVGIDAERVSRFKTIHHNMVVAKKVCDENNLKQLKVPSCILEEVTIQGKIYPVLVMDYHKVNHDPAVQKMFYLGQTDHLKEAITQLGTFIRLTGWNFVTWKKMPILEDSLPEYNSGDHQYKVLLLINEEMGSPELGIMGGKVTLNRRSLKDSGATGTQTEVDVPGLLACIPPSYRHLILSNPPALEKRTQFNSN